MEHALIYKLALIGGLALGAQWLAWRLKLPAIVLLLAAGVLAGPVFGWLHPEQDFGELLRPLVGAAVAVILFEGGLSLKLRELREVEVRAAVQRLVFAGVPFAWLLGAAAAHYVAGLSWGAALLFGGILVVTGPTVIMPLLRQARLDPSVGSVLKWEGIVNDPIGALLAVLVFKYLTAQGAGASLLEDYALASAAIAGSAALGYLAGRLFAAAFERGHVAEFLKGPTILGLLLVCYAAGNLLQQEAGLVAVTVLGITLANSPLASLDEMRRQKEYLTVLLVSGVFVILTATLERSLLTAFDWRWAAFLGIVLFVVRPVTVLLVTAGSALDWRRRALVAWIAPRGIVAVAMAGLFAPTLVAHGYADGAQLVPLAFAVVFATVVAHGFTLKWLARRLDLAAGPEHGVLVVGATPFGTGLTKALVDLDVPVLLADSSAHRLREARKAELPLFCGEVLSELGEHHLDLSRYDYLVAVTDNDAYNALVCSALAPELGRNAVLQLSGQEGEAAGSRGLRSGLRGRTLLDSGLDFDRLDGRLREGWKFAAVEIAEDGPLENARGSEDEALAVMVRRSDGELAFRTEGVELEPQPGDALLLLRPAGGRSRPDGDAPERN